MSGQKPRKAPAPNFVPAAPYLSWAPYKADPLDTQAHIQEVCGARCRKSAAGRRSQAHVVSQGHGAIAAYEVLAAGIVGAAEVAAGDVAAADLGVIASAAPTASAVAAEGATPARRPEVRSRGRPNIRRAALKARICARLRAFCSGVGAGADFGGLVAELSTQLTRCSPNLAECCAASSEVGRSFPKSGRSRRMRDRKRPRLGPSWKSARIDHPSLTSPSHESRDTPRSDPTARAPTQETRKLFADATGRLSLVSPYASIVKRTDRLQRVHRAAARVRQPMRISGGAPLPSTPDRPRIAPGSGRAADGGPRPGPGFGARQLWPGLACATQGRAKGVVGRSKAQGLTHHDTMVLYRASLRAAPAVGRFPEVPGVNSRLGMAPTHLREPGPGKGNCAHRSSLGPETGCPWRTQ